MPYFRYGTPKEHFIIKDFEETKPDLMPFPEPLFSFCCGVLNAETMLNQWREEVQTEYIDKYKNLICNELKLDNAEQVGFFLLFFYYYL